MSTRSETEELFDLLHVRFPRPVGFSELQQILAVVSKGASCEVEYQASFAGNIGRVDPEVGQVMPSEFYAKGISGTFRRGVLDSISFQVRLDNDYDSVCGPETRAKGLRFVTTPGYDTLQSLEGRRVDSLDVMRSVTSEVRGYFAPRQE